MTHPESSPRRRILGGLYGAAMLAVLLLGAAEGGAKEAPLRLAPKAKNTAIERDTRLQRGLWRLPDEDGDGALQITKDGVTLTLSSAILQGAKDGTPPDQFEGVGILIDGAKDVTIRGGAIRGYKVAILARNAPGLTIQGVDASGNYKQRLLSTPQREDPSDWLWPHENDKDEWQSRYGAGFSLTDCALATVTSCRVRGGQNGLLLTRCKKADVQQNDFSFNSGWGIALYRTTDSTIASNRLDWCVRGYSHGVYHRGQDSAGLLVFEQSSRNRFLNNSATHGGDGFFLYAGHETTKRTGEGGSNDNLVFDNDFSHAVANAIEATFSTGNTFVRNDCSDSDHGFWGGYSADTLISGNKLDDCITAGISIEHGQENRIIRNQIRGGRTGIHLWWDADPELTGGIYGQKRDTTSSKNLILANDILGAKTAIHLEGDGDTILRWNALSATDVLLLLGPGTLPGEILHNHFRGTRLMQREPPWIVLDQTEKGWALPPDNTRVHRLRGSGATDPERLPLSRGFLRPPTQIPDSPRARGSHPVRLEKNMPRGRAEIHIGEWGPLDPRKADAVPRTQVAAGRKASFQLVGRGAFAVKAIHGLVQVTPRSGTLPATLKVTLQDEAAAPGTSDLVPFQVDLELAEQKLQVRGSLLRATFDVRFFQWTKDPRKFPEAFEALTAGQPAKRLSATLIHFPWQGGHPEGVRKDRFATTARTSLHLDPGRYRFRTVSDDGIRVTVDGTRVIDNWTHHGPTEDVGELTLKTGKHEILIEHFEIDGWAQLDFTLERINAPR